MSSISHRPSPVTSCLPLSNGSAGKFQKLTANDEINGTLRILLLSCFDFICQVWGVCRSSRGLHMIDTAKLTIISQYFSTPPQTPKKMTMTSTARLHYTTSAQIWGESESVCGFWLVSVDKFHRKIAYDWSRLQRFTLKTIISSIWKILRKDCIQMRLVLFLHILHDVTTM